MARRSDHSREELRELALQAAKRIVESEGFPGLSARRVAREIGYTIGTIYNVFENFDDLIDQMNGQTLDLLNETCSVPELEGDPADWLNQLAERYIRFAADNPKLYVLIFEHQHPAGQQPQDWYFQKIEDLLRVVEASIKPVMPDATPKQVEAQARVLWAGVHGIISLEGPAKIGGSSQARELVGLLLDNFFAAVGKPAA